MSQDPANQTISGNDVFVSYASQGDAGCLSDEISNLVGPAERPHKEVRAGLSSHGWRDARRSRSLLGRYRL